MLAIDIGGTKLAAALVDPQSGRVHAEHRCPTPTGQGAGETFAPLAGIVGDLVRDLGMGRVAGATEGTVPTAIGIASAGPLDLPDRISPLNIPAWRGFDVVSATREAVTRFSESPVAPVPCRLLGDAQAMAYGEFTFGAGLELSSMIGVVVSTGIGAAVVSQGELVTGPHGNAGNLGHTSVKFDGPPCWCGGRGCVEWYASGPSMVRRAREQGWDPRERTATMPALAADARAGHPIALHVIDEGMRALAAGLAALATTSDVTDIVLGGGVASAGEIVLEPLRRHLVAYAGLAHVRDLAVRSATLEGAGLLGAAAAAVS